MSSTDSVGARCSLSRKSKVEQRTHRCFPFSLCVGYATDNCSDKAKQVQTIAMVEASINGGVLVGYLLCSFVFQLHAQIWQILLVHVLLLALALFVSLAFLRSQPISDFSTLPLRVKLARPFVDIRELLLDLKHNRLLVSFGVLLGALFFHELFRTGSGSIYYLYLRRMAFTDTQYAVYFTCEQVATCIALLLLALIQRRWRVNDLYLCAVGLALLLIDPMLFAFAGSNKAMIFGGRPAARCAREMSHALLFV